MASIAGYTHFNFARRFAGHRRRGDGTIRR